VTLLYFAGAEDPSAYEILSIAGAERVAINVAQWGRNYRQQWPDLDRTDFPEWLAWSDSVYVLDDLLALIDLIGKPPTYIVGDEECDWNVHPGFLPLWEGHGTMPRTVVGGGIAVVDRVFTDSFMSKQVLSSRKREQVLCAITGKSRHLEKWDIVVTAAWQSTIRYGETQIWDGSHLHRLEANRKSEIRSKFTDEIEGLGVDPWNVLADDSMSVATLAVRSWMAFEDKHLSPVPTDISEVSNELESAPPRDAVIPERLMTTRSEGRHVLPSMALYEQSIAEKDGHESMELQVGSVDSSLRRCDNCFLAPTCPAYTAGSECGYAIPVRITNKRQMMSVLNAMLEIQTQRVFQHRFAEEVQGQELDPATSTEMAKLFAMADRLKAIADERDTLSINVSATAGTGNGVLSQLFGKSVGEAAMEYTHSIDSEDILEAIEVGE
jgi:hypothetical protein